MRYLALTGAAALLALTPARADEPCGLCASEVVMTSSLARCFLEQYAQLEAGAGEAVAVDLSSCAESQPLARGVVDALPSPLSATSATPQTEFIVSRDQLGCLKEKLQDPGLVLDPSATIKLDACNGQTSAQ